VFDDGPPPTNQRWCNNGVSLKFIPKDGGKVWAVRGPGLSPGPNPVVSLPRRTASLAVL